VLGVRTSAPEPSGATAVGDEERPEGRRRRSSGCPEPVADGAVEPAEPGRGRVAVAPIGDRRVVGDDRSTSIVAGNGGGQARSGSASARPTVVRVPSASRSRASPVVAQNRSRERWASRGLVAVIVRHHRPETKAHRGLDRSLAVAPPGRARLDDGPVVLGDRGEARLDVAGARHDHRRQPVGAPDPRRARRARITSSIASMRWAGPSTPTARRGPPRVRQRAEQHVGGPAPRGRCAARTSPTGSPRPPGGRSRWCRDPSRRAGLAVRAQPGERTWRAKLG
jgi:hypothetical protein